MSFDVGGFLGGIVGAAGAYAAAWLTIRAERNKDRPKMLSQSYEVALDMQLKISSLHITLQTLPESTVFEVIETFQGFTKVFAPIMARAIESNEELARIGFFLYEQMDDVLENPLSNGNALTWKREETKVEGRAIVERFDKAMLQALIEIRTVLNEIRSQYKIVN